MKPKTWKLNLPPHAAAYLHYKQMNKLLQNGTDEQVNAREPSATIQDEDKFQAYIYIYNQREK